MRFHPAADPWGTAMLAAAAVVALATLVLLIATAMRTSKRAGGWILAVGLLGFLGAATGGTAVRIVAADREASRPVPPPPKTIVAPPPPADVDGGTVPTVPAEPDPSARDTAPPSADADVPTPDEPEAVPTAPAEPSSPVPPANEDLADPPSPEPAAAAAEPAEPAAPAVAAIPLPSSGTPRDVLEHARALAEDRERCLDPAALAGAWAAVSALPEAEHGRAAATARALEDCRRRIVHADTYRRRRARIDARDAFADALRERLDAPDDDAVVFVRIFGMSHERLRIGGRAITPARVAALQGEGLVGEIEALGFAEVAFSDGRTADRRTFSPPDERDLAEAALRELGLAQPLRLP